MSGNGFDDRDRSVERDGPTQDLDHDAPGFDVGGAAAIGQANELTQGQVPTVALQPAVKPATHTAPKPAVIEAAQPVVQLAPDGGGGGGTMTRGTAAEVLRPPPTAAFDASAQLRAAQQMSVLNAVMDEPAARTPVALRRRKKAPPTAERTGESETETDTTKTDA